MPRSWISLGTNAAKELDKQPKELQDFINVTTEQETPKSQATTSDKRRSFEDKDELLATGKIPRYGTNVKCRKRMDRNDEFEERSYIREPISVQPLSD
ncbi:hypothetical protein V8E54_008974 [Elaphomyces granulatus]